MGTRFCEKCHRTKNDIQFYKSNNLEKYPDNGKLNICKPCLTMFVNNWDPETYLWILQEIDVPYVPEEWNKLLASYARDPEKVNGTTILGRYLSKMQLAQFKKYRWKDTEFLQELSNKKIREAMEKQGYEEHEIVEQIEKASFTMPSTLPIPNFSDDSSPNSQTFDPADINSSESDDLGAELTDEEKLALRLKWGKAYKPEEWIQLETLYNQMCDSYDIQSAGHIDTLKLICKTSLKANQLIDLGDIDGFNKASKTYDMLMKSGKFTAAQNKSESGNVVDSIGELVALCEKDGFIAKYYIDQPNDKVDRVLQDMQEYAKNLIMDESNLGNLIENALKQIERDKEHEADIAAEGLDEEEALEAELFESNRETFLQDEDFTALWDMETEMADEDELAILDEEEI